MRRTVRRFFCLSFILLTGINCRQGGSPPSPVAAELRSRLCTPPPSSKLLSGTDSVFSPDWIRKFYEDRSYRPAWSTEECVNSDADSLIAAIADADQDGLSPHDYHLDGIGSAMNEVRMSYAGKEKVSASRLADLDFLLSDAFLLYASHLAEGRVNPDSLHPKWHAGPRGGEYDNLLNNALESHTVKIRLRALLPAHALYAGLKGLLSSLAILAKEGGWGYVEPGVPLKAGDVGPRVMALRKRLGESDDLRIQKGGSRIEYDSSVVAAVRHFQGRHGLEQTGTVDSSTMTALNVPVERRIEQVRVNLERWRWMPHDLGRKNVRVNIPDFRLTVEEDGKEKLTMKVVLGLPEWQTPVFNSQMTQVLLNVHWIAPDDIVAKELINYMKADTNYLPGNKMSLWRRSGDSLVRVDPHTVHWSQMNSGNIDFVLRQEAGPQNIMGQIKFFVQNKYSIYLHDTPYREDFPKNVRMFSHGCIRLEKPGDLAEYILAEYPGWSRERIDSVIAGCEENSIILKRPVPVHVLYYTAWRDRDGAAQFREDYYGLDRRLAAALR